MWADSSSVGPGPCLFSAKVPLCLLCVLQYSFFLSVYHVFFSTVFFLIEVKLVYKHYIPVMLLSGVWFFATHALQPARFMGFSRQEYWSCHFLLQRIFLTQGSNPGLLHCRLILYPLSYQGSPFPSSNQQSLQADSLPSELSQKPAPL